MVMGMRKKLIELLADVGLCHYDVIADHLIANDVVPVVRCKDCKHWNIRTGNDPSLKYYCNADGMWCKPVRSADDFCSYGERKDNEI
jgi:hypothetical protein